MTRAAARTEGYAEGYVFESSSPKNFFFVYEVVKFVRNSYQYIDWQFLDMRFGDRGFFDGDCRRATGKNQGTSCCWYFFERNQLKRSPRLTHGCYIRASPNALVPRMCTIFSLDPL